MLGGAEGNFNVRIVPQRIRRRKCKICLHMEMLLYGSHTLNCRNVARC